MDPRVSLTMIVRDEAGTLARSLWSVRGLVDETVVVDTGSRDATREVAAGLGARVVEHAWRDSFAEARNVSLRQARGRWVFWLDGDEWLDEVNRGRFEALCRRLDQEERPSVYFMEQSSPLGQAGGGTLSVAQPRLFRNGPEVCWRYRVHEQVLPSCLARGDLPRMTDVVIAHSGYMTQRLARRKEERNHHLLELERQDHPDDPWVLLQLGRLELETRFERAESSLTAALARLGPRDPLCRQVLGLLARGYRRAGRPDRASAVLEAGLAAFPNDTALRVEEGALQFELGRFDEAEAAFSALLARPADPDEFLGPVDPSWRGWQARHNLAVLEFRRGRPDAAEAYWRSALAERPDAAQLWLGLAELHLSRARWDDLETALSMCQRCLPGPGEVGLADVLTLRARARLQRGDHAAARAALVEAVQRDPAAVEPRLLLARVCIIDGDDVETAETALREVLVLAPDHSEAKRCLAALEKALDDPAG